MLQCSIEQVHLFIVIGQKTTLRLKALINKSFSYTNLCQISKHLVDVLLPIGSFFADYFWAEKLILKGT